MFLDDSNQQKFTIVLDKMIPCWILKNSMDNNIHKHVEIKKLNS